MTRTFPAIALAAILAWPAAARAEGPAQPTAVPAPPGRTTPTWITPVAPAPGSGLLAEAARREAQALVLDGQAATGAEVQPQRPKERRSLTRKILGGVAGGVGGFFLGGYLGAKIEGDRCNCDDPGLQGIIIGAPIGGIAGAIAGTLVL
jgi:hypothetical protein